jgi:uncharacterized protein YbjT (DUF2867 family)
VNRETILLTGATGYVGGRLLRALEERGARVRCLARRPEFLRPRLGPGTEVVQGDVRDAASLRRALEDVGTAYYLVHSMGSRGRFAEEDRLAAEAFGAAARERGVRRLVYLGGLGAEEDLSTHLASRQEVGRLLRESGVPTIEFRASIILGSGSLSFELIRALVEKLPVMITPRWVRRQAQPIGIEDVVAYLLAALDVPAENGVFEIGGPDRASYLDLMLEYARQRGLRRWILPVPVLSPGLSSLWLGLVTPIYARVGRKLIDSLRHDTVVTDSAALDVFPIRPRGLAEAIARALRNEDHRVAETRWSDALSSGAEPAPHTYATYGSRIVDSRAIEVPVSPSEAFAPVRRIGGKTGWYYGNGLWALRGLLDRFLGGPGLRRARRDPEYLVPGEALDFWRVEAVEPDRLLRLFAEMKVPGRAWLQFEVEPVDGGSRIRQTALFDPRGLGGRLYWYLLYPLHHMVFQGMLRGVAEAAVRRTR